MDNNINRNLDALDLMTVLLSYLSLHNYEQEQKQNQKLDAIIYDMERKLEYQDALLEKILRKVEDLSNGR